MLLPLNTVPGLTDEELRATPVPVSGTVTASGPLTDAQLRASAVPVSAAALPLPSGAATDSSAQEINTFVQTIAAQQVDGTQQTNIYGASVYASSPPSNASGLVVRNLPSASALHACALQSQIAAGTLLADNSVVSSLNNFTISAQSVSIGVQNAGGAWTGTIVLEVSTRQDNTFTTIPVFPTGSGTQQSSITANGEYMAHTAGAIYVRLRASGALTASGAYVYLYASNTPNVVQLNPLPTGANIIGKVITADSLVPYAFDFIDCGYTGDDLTQVVYKTGGSGGSTVATLTIAYSGSKIDTITRT